MSRLCAFYHFSLAGKHMHVQEALLVEGTSGFSILCYGIFRPSDLDMDCPETRFFEKPKIRRFTCFLTTSGRTACCSWKHLKRMLKIYKIRFQILFHACSNLETAWPLYAYTTEDFSNTKTFSDHPLQIKHMHSAFPRIIMLSILTLSCSLRKNGH